VKIPVVGTGYAWSVTDGNSCGPVTGTIDVTEPTLLTLVEDSVTNSNCGNADGAVGVSTNGGTTGYTYLWSNGATTEDLSGVVAGAYILTVTDINGCTASLTSVVNDNTGMTAGTVVVDAGCNGSSTGSVDLTVTGGTSPYTYAWDNLALTEDLSNIVAGTYNVTVTDAAGCTVMATAIVGEASAITANAVALDADCNGSLTGSVDLTASGGTGALTYLWSNGATTEDLSGVAAGT